MIFKISSGFLYLVSSVLPVGIAFDSHVRGTYDIVDKRGAQALSNVSSRQSFSQYSKVRKRNDESQCWATDDPTNGRVWYIQFQAEENLCDSIRDILDGPCTFTGGVLTYKPATLDTVTAADMKRSLLDWASAEKSKTSADAKDLQQPRHEWINGAPTCIEPPKMFNRRLVRKGKCTLCNKKFGKSGGPSVTVEHNTISPKEHFAKQHYFHERCFKDHFKNVKRLPSEPYPCPYPKHSQISLKQVGDEFDYQSKKVKIVPWLPRDRCWGTIDSQGGRTWNISIPVGDGNPGTIGDKLEAEIKANTDGAEGISCIVHKNDDDTTNLACAATTSSAVVADSMTSAIKSALKEAGSYELNPDVTCLGPPAQFEGSRNDDAKIKSGYCGICEKKLRRLYVTKEKNELIKVKHKQRNRGYAYDEWFHKTCFNKWFKERRANEGYRCPTNKKSVDSHIHGHATIGQEGDPRAERY